ncbi:PaaI family thioesterase [Dokdonella sp.]|uniref:PaaI family thioesterase n=1 Tax=Dokdonella sp. TaxID=2291710 RepID=UPI0035296E8E
MHVERFSISERFRGPPKSGNGGYVCGRIAAHLHGTARVRLKAPPPLEVELRLETSDQGARLFLDETLIGEAGSAQLDLEVPAVPTFEQAEASSHSFVGFHQHPFPGCFVCGPERELSDGLRIFPGATGKSGLVAAPWIPDHSLANAEGLIQPEFLWSALDCTGAFAILPLAQEVAIVLGELTASVPGSVSHGDQLVAVGWKLGVEGRKHFAGSAICNASGEVIARARAVWIEVPLSQWH